MISKTTIDEIRPTETQGTGPVLFVDDAAPLGRVVARYLASSGYETLVATNGGDALAILRGLPEGVRALITDVGLPDMSGRELVHHCAPFLRGAPVLYISGIDAPPHLQAVLKRNCGFLQKPFALEDLRSRLERLLEGTARAHAADLVAPTAGTRS